jgi:transposase
MARARNGKAIRKSRRRRPEIRRLKRLLRKAEKARDLLTWRRAKAVLGYIEGVGVKDLSSQVEVTRGSINRWIQWFDARGAEGLAPRTAPGAVPRLTEEQRQELVTLIEAGPISGGYQTGLWTGPMIGDFIRRRYGVHYHNHHVPRLLHSLGFSVQRPRRRLAKADLEKQEEWLNHTLPKIKKKRPPVVEWYYSGTKPASGSMGHSIKPGRESVINLE